MVSVMKTNHEPQPRPSEPALGYLTSVHGVDLSLTPVGGTSDALAVAALQAAAVAVIHVAGWTLHARVEICAGAIMVRCSSGPIRDRVRRALAERNLSGRASQVLRAMQGAAASGAISSILAKLKEERGHGEAGDPEFDAYLRMIAVLATTVAQVADTIAEVGAVADGASNDLRRDLREAVENVCGSLRSR